MALIHQILYETEGVEHVNFKNYIRKLIEAIKESYPSNKGQISYQLHVADIHFDLERALSLGLITHEVIMNAVKHAFPPGTEGEIQITLNKLDDTIKLTIEDNGVGLQEKGKRPGAIGMELVSLLTEQLRGHMEVFKRNGTVFHMVLPK